MCYKTPKMPTPAAPPPPSAPTNAPLMGLNQKLADTLQTPQGRRKTGLSSLRIDRASAGGSLKIPG